jgi:hypothetical protein
MYSNIIGGKVAELRHSWQLSPGYFAAGIMAVYETATDSMQSIRKLLTHILKNRFVLASATREMNWTEIVLFCIHEPHNATEPSNEETPMAVDEDAALDDDKQQRSAHVWLVRPMTFTEYELITDDIIEMRDSHKLLPHQYRMKGPRRRIANASMM